MLARKLSSCLLGAVVLTPSAAAEVTDYSGFTYVFYSIFGGIILLGIVIVVVAIWVAGELAKPPRSKVDEHGPAAIAVDSMASVPLTQFALAKRERALAQAGDIKARLVALLICLPLIVLLSTLRWNSISFWIVMIPTLVAGWRAMVLTIRITLR